MTMAFLSLNTYRIRNRVIVQYYDSGSDSKCLCPECGHAGELPGEGYHEIGCLEVCCTQCGTALAMISSKLEDNNLEVRCI